jgi:uncharacterized protein with LGFP repeats
VRVVARLLAGLCVVAAVVVGVPGIASAAVPGLQERVNAGSAFAAARGTTLGFAVYDRLTREYADNGALAHTRIESASVMKVFIADSVLRRRDLGHTTLTQADFNDMAAMLRSSDNGPASRLWMKYGANGIITDVKARYRLDETGPTANTRYWGHVLITAHDMVSYYDRMLTGMGGLSPASRDFLLEQLRLSTQFGSDGYRQFFGLRDGLPGEGTIRQKQGWMCCHNGAISRHSTGLVGPDSRFVVAALAKEPSGFGAAHVEGSLTGALRTAFPERVIPAGLTAIDQAWVRTGGGWGLLGQPVSSEARLALQNGAYRWFQRGGIYWTANSGAHWISGAIGTAWGKQGYERGPLLYPTTDEIALTGNRGAFQWFQGGATYWSPRTGAHWLTGDVLSAWGAQRHERGPLGFPTSDRITLADGTQLNRFQGGSLYDSPAGTHWVIGAIHDAWRLQGYERGPLRYPTTNEVALTGGRGAYSLFQGGASYWSSATGARWLTGDVLTAWRAQGAETGRLGFPTSNRLTLADGTELNRFQGGSLYDSPVGTHAVLGAIHDLWKTQGHERGPLGYPTSDETPLSGRTGASSTFQNGAIYWSPTTGAHWMASAVQTEWVAQGGATGALGLPTVDPAAVAGGTRTTFEGGTITVAADGQMTTVLDPP